MERPAVVCRRLLDALDAADGRSRRRKRDQRPDAIGLGIKRALLEAVVTEDPAASEFEAWLLARIQSAGHAAGPVHAMARSVYDEWRLAGAEEDFHEWLAQGAPSEDRMESA